MVLPQLNPAKFWNGVQANPTLNAMEVIADALGLTIFQLWEKVRVLPRAP
jgi:hypothetical protein